MADRPSVGQSDGLGVVGSRIVAVGSRQPEQSVLQCSCDATFLAEVGGSKPRERTDEGERMVVLKLRGGGGAVYARIESNETLAVARRRN